jgi:hypothetical protein
MPYLFDNRRALPDSNPAGRAKALLLPFSAKSHDPSGLALRIG